MRLLVTTGLPMDQITAAKTRLKRMALALRPHGIELILAGQGNFLESSWEMRTSNGFSEILYNANNFSSHRYSRALKFQGQAARFYKQALPELFSNLDLAGAITYSVQYQSVAPVFTYCQLNKKPILADMVELFSWQVKYFLSGVNYQQWLLTRKILPKIDGLIGVSYFWCDWAKTTGIPSVWIPSLAEDKGCVRFKPNSPDKPFTITFIGHWVERELPRILLKAMRLCIDKKIPIEMNVLGNVGKSRWERKAMRFLQADQILKKHIHFIGFVSDEEKERQLANADVFVILRKDCHETDALFPTRLPEYMLTGNPVILSEVGSFPKCFRHKKDVWFISKENRTEDLAYAFEYLANNPEERITIGQQGRESALRQFSLDVLGKRLAEFLKMVVVKK